MRENEQLFLFSRFSSCQTLFLHLFLTHTKITAYDPFSPQDKSLAFVHENLIAL